MKRLFGIFLIAVMVFSLTACSTSIGDPVINSDGVSSTTKSNSTKANDNEKKVLIAYFSATGNTKKIAEYIADATKADIYEIVPATPYTSDDLKYNDSNCRANIEMNDPSCRPKINGSVKNMVDYDIVFIGYPIWWGDTPRIVSTFVESYDFLGKTVVTFCTSGSSEINDTSIKKLTSGANWITGARFNNDSTKNEIVKWINDLSLDIKLK